MPHTKQTVLTHLSVGRRVAEEEIDELARYFVETEQWRKVISDEVDVVFGPKGSGKSAIYATLLKHDGALFDKEIILVSAENPQGTPAFKNLISDPPTGELEFVGLWKLYVLSLIASLMDDYRLRGEGVHTVKKTMAKEGLLPANKAPLSTRLSLILRYVRRLMPSRIDAEVKFDLQTSEPTAIGGGITFAEPSAEQSSHGAYSIDSLLQIANEALRENNVTVWLLLDRLDVAFAGSRELEANGLRALFKSYLDLLSSENIRLKIFLRSDVWGGITRQGFREASHITRQMEISWSPASLLNLVVKRLVANEMLMQYTGQEADEVLKTADLQRQFFDILVPDQVDAGRNPKTFEWILGRVKDGTQQVAPREVIHLLSEARDSQLKMLEQGVPEPEPEPANHELFSRQALREALAPVSKTRLEQTIYAEYPKLREPISALHQEKSEQSLESLAQIWATSTDSARSTASLLIEAGVFEHRGTKAEPRYWIPFLYRPALSMIQGSA